MTNHLLLGTRDSRGNITALPIIVTLDADGTVAEWHPLTSCEPHSTTPLRAILDLPSLTILPLPR